MCGQCSELLLSWYSTSQITKPGPRSRRIYPWGRGGSELPHFTALSPPLNLWNCINQILKSLEQTMLLLKKKKSFFIQVQMLVVEHVSLQKISLLLKIKLFPIISLNEHMYLAFSFIFFFKTRSSIEEEMLMSDEIKFPRRAFAEKKQCRHICSLVFVFLSPSNVIFISSVP